MMTNKKLTIALMVCVAVCCLMFLTACKRPCVHQHTHSEVTVDPTCTATGVSTVYCDNCSEIVRRETVDALGHSFGVAPISQVGATCTQEGYKIVKCVRCEQTDNVSLAIDSLAHAYGEWTLLSKPTLYSDGEYVKICDNDATHTESKAIPSLSTEGIYTVNVTRNPSCSQVGLASYSSEIHGEYEIEIPRLAHTFDESREAYCKVCNQKYYSAGLKYTLSDDGEYYIVSSGGLTDNNVVIPAEYNGKPVKEIASEGFAYKNWIYSVTIPEYIERINSGAFNNSGIRNIYYNAINCADFNPKNWVFNIKNDITEVVIGNKVEHIPARMFYPLITDDTVVNVLKLTFEDGSVCKTIGEYAFNKTALKSLKLPDSVTSIGDYAFYNTNITSLTLGKGLITLGNSCFGANGKLREIAFGSNLASISDDCFNYCTELLSVDLSASKVASIGDDAFKGCAKLTSVKLPNTLIGIGKQAFYNCASLEELYLGNGLKKVGEQAFASCTSLKILTLPTTVTSLGNGAFSNCVDLREIYFNAVHCDDLLPSNMTFANIGTNGKLKVVFGDSVEYIPERLFYCSANVSLIPHIEELRLGVGITQVGSYAFMGVTIASVTYTGGAWSSVTVGGGNAALTNAVR